MRQKKIVGILTTLIVLGFVPGPVQADAPPDCSCIICGAECQPTWIGYHCLSSISPVAGCFFCMQGCGNSGGGQCCLGPPVW